MTKKKLGIIQSRGLGDIAIALPIADYYVKEGWEVHWPICREFLSHFYPVAPQIVWHPVETDSGSFFWDQPQKILDTVGVDEKICLYQALTGHPEFTEPAWFQHTKFDQYKYAQAGVPFHRKWQLAQAIQRQWSREEELYRQITAQIGEGKPYCLVHLQGSDHRADFDTSVLNPEWPCIEITDLTDSVWDWCTAIDRAEAVIFVDSVYSNITDQLALNTDEGRYFIPRSHIGLTPVLGQHWNWLENLRLPQASRSIRA